jgi:hypothetical protein
MCRNKLKGVALSCALSEIFFNLSFSDGSFSARFERGFLCPIQWRYVDCRCRFRSFVDLCARFKSIGLLWLISPFTADGLSATLCAVTANELFRKL